MRKRFQSEDRVRKGDRRGYVIAQSALSTRKFWVLWDDGERSWAFKSDLTLAKGDRDDAKLAFGFR